MEEVKKKEGAQEVAAPIDLIEIIQVLWKRAWVIVLCTVFGAMLAFGYTKVFITPQYQASAMLYVLGNSEGLNLQLSKQLTVDFMVLAKSRPVIAKVIDRLNLDISYEALVPAIQIENPENSSILKVSVISSDPKFAKDVANTLAEETADQIALVMVTDKPSTVENAVVPRSPISPNVTGNMMKGAALGFAAAVALLVLLHLMDDTIKSEDDMRKYLGINVLAVVPDRELYHSKKAKKRKEDN